MKSRVVEPIRRREADGRRKGMQERDTREMKTFSGDMHEVSVSGTAMRTAGGPPKEGKGGHKKIPRGQKEAYHGKKKPAERTKKKKLRLLWEKVVIHDAQYVDYNLLVVVVFLMCFGLVMLYSTSAYSASMDFDNNDMHYFTRQALFGALSFVGMLVVSKLDYHYYGPFSKYLYIFAIFLMALVQTPLGVTIYGARRWLNLPGGLTMQPSEIMKIAVILFVSYELCRTGKKAYGKEGFVKFAVLALISLFTVFFFTDNLSTALIVFLIVGILYFIVHPKMKPFVILLIAAAAAIGLGLWLLTNMYAGGDFRLQRIITWLDIENNAEGKGFQVLQGLYAIGSGGFFGKGLGNSTQKLGVIPEVQNDMILSIVCEELGIFGAIVILVLFGILLYRLMFIAQNAPDLYGSLIATGIFAHIALQVILNIAVVTNMIPTTGITLPFISYGGTSILFLMAEMGIALGISRTIRLKGE